jgi:hypothetical protein
VIVINASRTLETFNNDISMDVTGARAPGGEQLNSLQSGSTASAEETSSVCDAVNLVEISLTLSLSYHFAA